MKVPVVSPCMASQSTPRPAPSLSHVSAPAGDFETSALVAEISKPMAVRLHD
jgi:hypothetical protein